MAVTIVIHELGQTPKKVSCPEPAIRIGRDPEAAHIVLTGGTVSRDHALIAQERAGRWSIRCVSETNPIIVDGALISGSAVLSEGSEVLIGTEHLLIFSLDDYKANSYMGDKSYFSRSECEKCHWQGMVSTLRRQPICPRCASTKLIAETEYRRDSAVIEAAVGETQAVSTKAMKEMLNRLKTAKRSKLERLDGREGATRKELSEQQPLALGKGTDAQLKLTGFLWGKGVTIAWDGSRFVATSSMIWPSLKVNGQKQKEASLTNGDVLEIGGNRFKFITE